ncbi:MAG: hypothetical protein JWM04_1661 [Verrucomicrobiales bacterium]|nr:hypothetical protein [Verrucomicrobiales bacterium]
MKKLPLAKFGGQSRVRAQKKKLMAINAPDLTQRPPRSARVRLGGFAILPRMLDKGRATVNGKHGEFHYNCPLDQNFLEFVGIDAEQLKTELAAGKSDTEILEWINQTAKSPKSSLEAAAWSAYQDFRGPTDLESRQFFNDYHAKMAPKREDVSSWFDILDIDDFVSYGGNP